MEEWQGCTICSNGAI